MASKLTIKTQPSRKKKPRGRPFPPGNCANPKGRPKVGNTVAELTREILEKKKKGQRSKQEEILETFAEFAKSGSVPHATFLFGYGYGKPQESLNVSGSLSLYEQGARDAAETLKTKDRTALIRQIRKLTTSDKTKK